MDLLAQLMMAVGLATCAGLRAWLPLLVVSVMARAGYVTLGGSFEFLARDDALIIFTIATVLEIMADKFVGLDHLLDAVGIVARPVAGAVMASAVLIDMDPLVSVILGVMAGGASSLLVHSGKSIVRVKTTALAPVHGGAGNALVSSAEDLTAGAGAWFVLTNPILAFVGVVLALVGAAWVVRSTVRLGTRVVSGTAT